MNTNYKIYGKALSLANAFGFLFPGEVFLIQAIARSLPEKAVAVNIGAGVGTGALALTEIRPDLKVYTVDISEGGPQGGFQNEINAFHDAEISPIPTHILGNSQEVHKGWLATSGGAGIDFLFVDGDHAATALQGDIDGWLPFIKHGGYVLFHDYTSVNWGDVKDVIDTYMKKHSISWKHVITVDTVICFRRSVKDEK